MKKFLTITATILVIVGAAGYAVWHFGTNIASEKIVQQVEANLNDEDKEEVKSYIAKDPKLQEIVNEAATTDPDSLPFQTKEEATRLLIKKVGINRLLAIQEQAQNGSMSIDEVVSEMEGTLTEDEISALKYVLYKELYNQN